MRQAIVFDPEVARIHAKVDRKISRFVGKLFPDRRLIKWPLVALEEYHGDIFETMTELHKWHYFKSLSDKELQDKYSVAVEIVLHLMHHRSKSRIISGPNNCHLAYVKRLIGPWYKLELKDLREVRSQIIAMQSEGSPLD